MKEMSSPFVGSVYKYLSSPKLFLKLSAQLWFVVAFVGQWIFVYYVAAFYVPILRHKGFEGLSDTHLPNGYVSGDFLGNLALSLHLVIAIAIIGGGTLQLIPWIRNTFPTFHKYLGRTYVFLATTTSIAGLYLIWTRGTVGGLIGNLGLSLDGILIIVFSLITVRFAMVRNIPLHRRWALRLFMVVSAVWFFRIGLMFWMALTGGMGINFETFTGPFLTILFFAQMIVPLLFLELYFQATDRSNNTLRYIAGLLILLATFATAIGIGVATLGMWVPRL